MQVDARGMTISPCPKCGSFGRVPDGVYSLYSAAIRDPGEADKIQRFMAIMERHIRFPSSLPQMMNELSDEGVIPTTWKPKNAAELVAWIGIILTVLQVMYSVYKDQHAAPPPPQRLSGDVKQVIEMILDRSIPPIHPPTQPPTEPLLEPSPPSLPPDSSK